MSAYKKDDLMSGINVSEANAKIPRKVQFDGAAQCFLALILMVVPVAAAWIANDDIRGSHLRDVLRREGSEARGEVVESSASREGVHVSYRFSADGVIFSGHAVMTSAHYRVPAQGTQIPIRYLPKAPQVNQPSNWEWDAGHIFYYLFGLAMLAAVGVLIIEPLRARKLARVGVVVEGRVTGCAPDRSRFTVYYEFTTKDKVGVEGKAGMPEECEVGISIPIMYLRSNPKRNDYYPM
jgi:hypothetical protein